MKKVIAAVAALAALAFSQTAFAANTATISVTHDAMILNGSHSTTIHVAIPQTTDPIARIDIFVPTAYSANLTQTAGTTIGQVTATAYSHDAGLTLPLSGNVVADNPASHTSDSQQCVGTPTSQAVWIMQLSVAGQAINLPLYVNPTVGASTALGKYDLTICLPPPDVPVGTPGRSAQGAQVLDAQFTVNGIFTTPISSGVYVWESLFTPYVPTKGVPNPSGTFEARAVEGLPVTLSLAKSYNAKTNTFTVTGHALEGGSAVPGVNVHVARGTSATRLTQQSSSTTNLLGVFRVTGKLSPRKTTYFRANASVGERAKSDGCLSPLPPTVAPAGCVSATLSPWKAQSALAVIKVAPPKHAKHKKKK